jgi:5'-3' exoribonuclease 2
MPRFQNASFIREIRTRYPIAFREIDSDRSDIHDALPPCDVLMIDLLHWVSLLFRFPESVNPRTHRYTPFFYGRIRKYLVEAVRLMRPRRLLYIAVDGQTPLAKLDERRRRQIERLDQKIEVATSFYDDVKDDPESETPNYRKIIQEAVENEPGWSDISVVFDSALNRGEAEHKFAAYVRSEKAEGRLPSGLHYAIFGLDTQLLSVALLLHEPNMMVVRYDECRSNLEIVDIRRLRTALARDYGNAERYIDDFVAIGLFFGTNYMPGVAPFESLMQAYQGAGGGFLVENGNVNVEVLEQFLLSLEGQGPNVQEASDDVELAKQYLKTYVWVLRSLLCGVSDWRWLYPSTAVPSLQALTEACESFDSKVSFVEPIPRLALLALKSAVRMRPEVPPELERLRSFPEMDWLVQTQPFNPFRLESFLEVYEKKLRPSIPPKLLGIDNERETRLVYRKDQPVKAIEVPEYIEFVSQDAPIISDIQVGEQVVVDKRVSGIVTAVNPDGTFDVAITRLVIPNVRSKVEAVPTDFRTVMQWIRGMVRIRKPPKVVRAILGSIVADGEHYGLKILMTRQLGMDSHGWKQEFRLASMLTARENRSYEEQHVSKETAEAVRQYVARVPNIEWLAQGPREGYTLQAMFNGDIAKAREFQRWIMKTVQTERPFVTWSLSRAQIRTIEDELKGIPPARNENLRGVRPERILRESEKVASPAKPDVTVPYVSTGADAFGEIGFIVGYSEITKVAAFVQPKESPKFSNFGGILERRIGILTTLDYLMKVESAEEGTSMHSSAGPGFR